MKKVLIIPYHWPPAGGPGVQRVLKFAKYLPKFGWQPIIMTVRDGEYLAYDHTLTTNVPQSIKVYKTSTFEPFSMYKRILRKDKNYIIPNLILTEAKTTNFRDKFAKWIRTNLFIPDARIGWIPFIKNEGLRIIKTEQPDLIFSTSPPHSVQIGAMKLAAKTGLPWIADFRDPWYDLGIFYAQNKRNIFSDSLDARFEKKVIQNATAIITNNHLAAQLYAKNNRSLDDFFIIPNGFDQEDFSALSGVPDEVFTITHSGTLSDTRIPFVLIKALSKLKKSEGLEFKLNLIGTISNKFISILHEYDLSINTQIFDYMPFKDALSKLKSSSVVLLVNVAGPNAEVFIPAKLFDYLGVKKPIFGIGPPDGAAADIIKKSDSGRMIDYNDENGAYQLLRDMIEDWQSKTSRFNFTVDVYEKQKLTEKLAVFFDSIIQQSN